MADKSKIQWCDATLNPAYGCSPVSPACEHCYAARMAGRLGALTKGTHKDGKWTGKINLFPGRMEQALRWRKPRRIFVGSMTDIFHPAIPDQFLDELFGVILANAYLERQAGHQFIILTKRPERMAAYFSQEPPTSMIRRWAQANDGSIILDNPDVFFSEAVGGHCSGEWDEFGRLVGEYKDWGFTNGLFPLPNVILMATIEDQPRADERMPHLVALARMGWRIGASIEPMLGPVDLTPWDRCDQCGKLRNGFDPYNEVGKPWASWQCYNHFNPHGGCDGVFREHELSWVICGGESGPEARPMHPDWARGLRDQCAAAGVRFFFKQWGEWGPPAEGVPLDYDAARARGAKDLHVWPDGTFVERVGKHRAGRLLDGVEHNAFPEARS